jgi:hypothetical protein
MAFAISEAGMGPSANTQRTRASSEPRCTALNVLEALLTHSVFKAMIFAEICVPIFRFRGRPSLGMIPELSKHGPYRGKEPADAASGTKSLPVSNRAGRCLNGLQAIVKPQLGRRPKTARP